MGLCLLTLQSDKPTTKSNSIQNKYIKYHNNKDELDNMKLPNKVHTDWIKYEPYKHLKQFHSLKYEPKYKPKYKRKCKSKHKSKSISLSHNIKYRPTRLISQHKIENKWDIHLNRSHFIVYGFCQNKTNYILPMDIIEMIKTYYYPFTMIYITITINNTNVNKHFNHYQDYILFRKTVNELLCKDHDHTKIHSNSATM
eukprot:512313_1